VPRSFSCSIAIRQAANNAEDRLEQAKFFSGLQDVGGLGAQTVVHVVSHNYAEVVSLDEEIVTQIMLTILIALTAVACVLVLAIPVHRAIITALNILLVVINILGFMGYAGITYNPVSFCTLTMAIGFCVDYTVELMHFSSTAAAGARMAQKMGGAVAVCGYDVLHGCCTAIVGCLVISFVRPSTLARPTRGRLSARALTPSPRRLRCCAGARRGFSHVWASLDGHVWLRRYVCAVVLARDDDPLRGGRLHLLLYGTGVRQPQRAHGGRPRSARQGTRFAGRPGQSARFAG